MTPLPTMFIAPPPKKKILDPQKFHFLLRSPQLFWSEIFRCPPKILGGAVPWSARPFYRNVGRYFASSPRKLT